jgi:hypothetical protein
MGAARLAEPQRTRSRRRLSTSSGPSSLKFAGKSNMDWNAGSLDFCSSHGRGMSCGTAGQVRCAASSGTAPGHLGSRGLRARCINRRAHESLQHVSLGHLGHDGLPQADRRGLRRLARLQCLCIQLHALLQVLEQRPYK